MRMACTALASECDVTDERKEFEPRELMVARSAARTPADGFSRRQTVQEHGAKTPETEADECKNKKLETKRQYGFERMKSHH